MLDEQRKKDFLQTRLQLTPVGQQYPFEMVKDEGHLYVVFKSEFDLLEFEMVFPELFEFSDIICWDAPYNAYYLGYYQ